MAVSVQVSETINRSPAVVFHFYADEHVRNHPRWDPDMHLEQVSPGPIGVGTVIRRRNTHFETPVEGTMEVVEFERDRAMGVVIHDGPDETHGRIELEALSPNQTRMIVSAEFFGLDESVKPRITTLMQRTARNIKQLVEAET